MSRKWILIFATLLFLVLLFVFLGKQKQDVNYRIDSANLHGGGYTVLHIACKEAAIHKIDQYLKDGADPNIQDNRGRPPLLWLISSRMPPEKFERGYKLLIENGADVNIPDINLQTALHIAATSRNYSKLELLLRNKPNVNARDRSGRTALHIACGMAVARPDDAACIKLLLSHGSNPNAKSHSGETSLDAARRANRSDLVDIISTHLNNDITPGLDSPKQKPEAGADDDNE